MLRAVLSAALVLCGAVILARMLYLVPSGKFGILPGVVLGAAMIALGLHRLSQIVRIRGMR